MTKLEKSLSDKISAFIGERLANKLEVFDKAASKKRTEVSEDQKVTLEETLQDDRLKLLDQFRPENWLTERAKKAWQITMVTHPPKYTHSDTRSAGILLRPEDKEKFTQNERYVDSLSLNNMKVDVAGNAAALDVAALLRIEYNGNTLLDEVVQGDSPALNGLAVNSAQAQEWVSGLRAALVDKALTSGQLAKQLYFPAAGSYHLVSPLYSSVLSQYLYDALTSSFYSEKAKLLRGARKNKRFHHEDLRVYPNVAKQSFGGSNQQNISLANSKRRGYGFLLSSQPPIWNQKTVVPKAGKHAFWREYDRRAWKTAKFLQSYLERIFNRTSTIESRDRRAGLIDELVDTLLIYAAEVQREVDQRGWSVESDLSPAEQLWLDPYRKEIDETFKAERDKNEWQGDIARQFSAWLNQKISYKSDLLYPGDPEFAQWQKLVERKLLLLKDDLEVAV